MKLSKHFIQSALSHTIMIVITAILCITGTYTVMQFKISDIQHHMKLYEIQATQRKYNFDWLKEEHKKELMQIKIQTVDVTAYSPRKEECDDDPLIAASLQPVESGTIAVSRDLFDAGWTFNKMVYVKGIGILRINDLMNKRFKKRIDIFMWSTARAIKFGKKQKEAVLLTAM